MLTLLELTNVCNMRCAGCGTWQNLHRKKGFFDLDLLERVFPSRYIHKVPLFWYGESYLHKGIYDCVGRIKQLDRGAEVYISTNGMFLDERGVENSLTCGFDEIFIAIDGTTSDVYESYRVGGNFDKVINGSRRLVERKRELGLAAPIITWQFIAFKSNEHQIEDAIAMARDIGFDRFLLKTTANEALGSVKYKRVVKGDEQVYGDTLIFKRIALDPAIDAKRASSNEAWWQVVGNAGLSSEQVKLGPPCYGPAILWDGVVIQCCWDAHAESYLGDIKQNSFDEIIEGVHYKHFLLTLHNGRNAVCNARHCPARPVALDDGYKLPEDFSRYESRHGEHKTNLILSLAQKNDHIVVLNSQIQATIKASGMPSIAELKAMTLDPDGSVLEKSGAKLPQDKALRGFLDRVFSTPKGWMFRGWAADTAAGRPADIVHIFADGLLAGSAKPRHHRPDVAKALGDERIASSGFAIDVPRLLIPDLKKVEIAACAIGDGRRAGILNVSPAYPEDAKNPRPMKG